MPRNPQPPTADVVRQPANQERARRRPALSPSRANDFKQCPLLFRFRVVDRLPEPASPAAARGTLVHAVLERLSDLPLGDRPLAAAKSMVAGEWDRILAGDARYTELAEARNDPGAWLAAANSLLATYFTLEDPNRLEPAKREWFAEWQLDDGPLLRGVVDRVDIAGDGAIRIVDYKTGKSPRPGYETSAAFQMRFYGFVVWRHHDTIPRMLQLVYLGDGKILRAEPTRAELEDTERQVRDLWSAIGNCATSGQWPTRRTPLCGWCAHQQLCPQFDGTPPTVDEDSALRALGIRA